MRTKKYPVKLSDADRKALKKLIKSGTCAASMIKRANILLQLDESNGMSAYQREIARQLNTSVGTVFAVSRMYAEQGLDGVLSRKQRETPPIQSKITGDVEARIIALACSMPPAGRSRWTLRLLEEKVVELGIVDTISDNTIGSLLKKRHLSLIRKSVGAYHLNKTPLL